jgi:Cytochrome c7 and related cytochrome c
MVTGVRVATVRINHDRRKEIMKQIIAGKKLVLVLVTALVFVMGCGNGDDDGKVVVREDVDVQALTGQNLNDFHLTSATQSNNLCIACHGDMSNEVATWNTSLAGPHSIHDEKTKLLCIDCHKSVDMIQKSAAMLRKQVSTKSCIDCHDETLFPGL